MKKRITNFGFSTILISFTMLCVVIFSVLALITAKSDYNLSQKYATKNFEYYETENRVYLIIADIDSRLLDNYQKATSVEEYYSLVTAELGKAYEGQFEANEDGTLLYSFDVEFTQLQKMQISLQICYPFSANDPFYQIKQWQLITDTSVEEDDTLNVIK